MSELREVAWVELGVIKDLAGGDVNLIGVLHPDDRVSVSNIWLFKTPLVSLPNLTQFAQGFLGSDL